MSITTTTIQATDGRDLCLETFGYPLDRAILFHSGTYAGRTLYPRLVEEAKQRDLFIIGYDRPGYGHSTAKAGRIIADCAEDVLSIARHFKLDRLATMGFSGGGAHSVASAVLLPELVSASVGLCSLMPPISPSTASSGLNEESEKNAGNQFLSYPSDLEGSLRKEREKIITASQEDIVAENMEMAEAQRVSLAFLEFHYRAMRSGLEPGIDGCLDDMRAYYTPWGIDLSTNRVPIGLWHGKKDVTVPYEHSEWLASMLPNSDLHLTEHDSHRSVFENNFDEALEWLLQISS